VQLRTRNVLTKQRSCASEDFAHFAVDFKQQNACCADDLIQLDHRVAGYCTESCPAMLHIMMHCQAVQPLGKHQGEMEAVLLNSQVTASSQAGLGQGESVAMMCSGLAQATSHQQSFSWTLLQQCLSSRICRSLTTAQLPMLLPSLSQHQGQMQCTGPHNLRQHSRQDLAGILALCRQHSRKVHVPN
jgi:hypothetical protein